METQEANYSDRVEQAVREAVDRGARTVREIFARGRGAFPTEILAALTRIGTGYPSLQNDVAGASSESVYESWPEPSPVDYEWRFAPATAAEIAARASDLGTPVACLGTPTVFARLVSSGVPAVLVDRNPFIVRAVSAWPGATVIEADIAELPRVLGGRKFAVMVMDPPWYVSHFEFWLAQATTIAAPNAALLATVFPELVRPQALAETGYLRRKLAELGCLELFPGSVCYETPFFEREALLALGIPAFRSWRVADLAVVRIEGSKQLIADPPSESAWERFSFGSQVVGLRIDPAAIEGITVTPVYEDGSFLRRSVSARDPLRDTIGLWTSRNRVARVTGIERVRSFLRALSADEAAGRAVARYSRNVAEAENLRLLLALIGW